MEIDIRNLTEEQIKMLNGNVDAWCLSELTDEYIAGKGNTLVAVLRDMGYTVKPRRLKTISIGVSNFVNTDEIVITLDFEDIGEMEYTMYAKDWERYIGETDEGEVCVKFGDFLRDWANDKLPSYIKKY